MINKLSLAARLLAVFALADVHRAGPLFELVGHFLGHIDPDRLRPLTNWICRHIFLLFVEPKTLHLCSVRIKTRAVARNFQ